jgi:rhodanese-related sulfurtransferase
MKKRRGVNYLFCLIFIGACTAGGNQNGNIAPEEILTNYLAGDIIISVSDAYEMYDQDTSGVTLLDIRDQSLFSKSHELGAVHLPYNEMMHAKPQSFPNYKNQVFLVYSDQFTKAVDAFFVLKKKGLPNVKVIQGNFSEEAGMLVDISMDARYNYSDEFEKAKKRFEQKPVAPPPVVIPKRKVITQKKKVVEEEEGC